MITKNLQSVIETAWENKESINTSTIGEVRDAVNSALAALDSGEVRVAEKIDSKWITNQWLKKAVLLSFRLNDSRIISGGPDDSGWFDKVSTKFTGWDEKRWQESGIRAVPDATVRYSAYVAPGAVLMPCFLNLGSALFLRL